MRQHFTVINMCIYQQATLVLSFSLFSIEGFPIRQISHDLETENTFKDALVRVLVHNSINYISRCNDMGLAYEDTPCRQRRPPKVSGAGEVKHIY